MRVDVLIEDVLVRLGTIAWGGCVSHTTAPLGGLSFLKEVALVIAVTDDKCPRSQENSLFLEYIPAIKRHARVAFRNLRPQERAEAVSEVVANAFAAFRRLAERGKLDVAYPSPLARFAVAQVRSGRRVGNKLDSRDVFSFVVQRQQGFTVESLEPADPDIWCEALVDNTVTPVADAAAFRLDFSTWLHRLQQRDRELIYFLSLGNTPRETAQRFRVSQARISQLRSALQASWREFQDEAPRSSSRSKVSPRPLVAVVA